MTILSKACKPDNFEPNNSLKLSFTNIRGLRSNFADCESFLESNSPDILALCETNLYDSTDSRNFSVRGYLPLIQKDSSNDMHGLPVYVKEVLPFAQDLSPDPENLLRLYARFLIVLSNIDEVLLINSSANVLVFRDFKCPLKGLANLFWQN